MVGILYGGGTMANQFEVWGADGAFHLEPCDELAWASDGLVWKVVVVALPIIVASPPIKNWFIHRKWATFRRDPDMVTVAPIDHSDAIAVMEAEREDLIRQIHNE